MFGPVDEDEVNRVSEDIKNILDKSKMEQVTSNFFKTHRYNSNNITIQVIDNNDSDHCYGFSWFNLGQTFSFGTNFFLELPDELNSFFEIDIIKMSYKTDIPKLECVLYAKEGSEPICDMEYYFDGSKKWTKTLSAQFKKWLNQRDLTINTMDEDDWVVCFFDFKDMGKR